MATTIEAGGSEAREQTDRNTAIKRLFSFLTRVRNSQLATIWSQVLVPFACIRLALLLVGVVTIYYIDPLINKKQPIYLVGAHKQFPAMLWMMWWNFDSGFYGSIASGGYWSANTLRHASNWAFFPLYPILMHFFALPLLPHSSAYVIAGVAISNIAAFIAVLFLYKIVAREFSAPIASRAVIYLALFPMSFFLSAAYPESLFMALILGCFYFTRTHRWWLAGLLGGLAALTRPQGILMAIVMTWEYWQYLSDSYAPLKPAENMRLRILDWIHSRSIGLWRSLRSAKSWLTIGAILEVPCGLLLFCLYGYWKVGTFTPFTITEKNGWNRSYISPIHLIHLQLEHPSPPSPYDWNFYLLNLIAIFVFLILLIFILRKLPFTYGIFSLCFVLMPLTTNMPNSITRYYMEVFPVFIILALWSYKGDEEQRMTRHTIISTLSAILLTLGMVLWALGVYSVA
jgi:hypothetical protein